MRVLLIFLIALALSAAPSVSAQTRAQVDALLEDDNAAGAFALARSGVENGDAELTGYLGWFYDQGQHVSHDPAKAASLYRTAAQLGDAYSQWRLAVMIDEGAASGTMEEAVSLLRKSAGQKNPDALVSLAVMHANGRGVAQQDHVAAMRYYQAAARLGSADGLLGLGIMHANGESVPSDLQEAVAHWLVAATMGNEMADALLTEHADKLTDGQTGHAFAKADMLAQRYGVPVRFEMAENVGS